MKRLGLVLASFFLIWTSAPSAQAHTELVSTSPTPNAQVAAPQPISLTFSEAPILEGSYIVVVDAGGNQYETGQLTLDGATLTGDWPADLPVGYAKIYWRAVSDDGHVVTGDYNFYYSAAAAEQSVITARTIPTKTASEVQVTRYYDNKLFLPAVVVAGVLLVAFFFTMHSRRNK